MPPTLYLIDGHALAYRTFFALTSGSGSSFQTRSGEPTAGVFGFTSVLLRLMEQEQPEYLAVAFDVGRTFRDDLFPAYKGTRAKMPDELRSQMERIRQLVDVFNLPRLELEGYEADDLLGTAAQQAVQAGFGVKIITGDRDLLQLVNERVIVSLPGKSLSDSKEYLPEDVVEMLGVRPDQVVDYKALVGDKSDNIPGVTGIGEKTAVSLLQTYHDLEGIYAHLDDLPAGTRKKLEAGREAADLSRTLARIVTDAPLRLDLEKARVDAVDPAQVEELFRELEFRTLMTRLTNVLKGYGKQAQPKGGQLSLFEVPAAAREPVMVTPAAPEPAGERETVVVSTFSALQELRQRLLEARLITFDTETTSTDPMRARLVGISLAVEAGRGYYIPVGHNTPENANLPLKTVCDLLYEPLTHPGIPKAGHNVKYDYAVLVRHGLPVTPLTFDTMIAEWLANPASHSLGLKNLAWVRLGVSMTHIEELLGKGKNQKLMSDVPVYQAAPYAAADAEVVLRLIPGLEQELKERQAERLLRELEMPLVPVLAEMEMAGVGVDSEFLALMSASLGERLAQIEAQVYLEVGVPFNLNSPQQLSTALFERLKIEHPDRKRTASGFYSTSADILELLRGKHPAVDLVLEYRELSKLRSTYLEALPLQVNPTTGRIHTSFNQTGSVTGRIAYSDPNLQNIPIRTELGRQVRKAFVAAPGQALLSVDYSQVELRIVAHMADDQAMIEAFRAGQDIHTATAAAIYGISLDQVDKDQRRRAKAINFGLIYGMSAFGLTRYADLTLAEAENFVKAYFDRFPGVREYLNGMRRQAAEQGYVETLLGRRRYFPALKTMTDRNQRMREEREAINAPIQGTAADIMKLAMLRLPAALAAEKLAARMILQVHDELVFECPLEEIRRTAAVVQDAMESAYRLNVPLLTEARFGHNWGQLEPVGL